MRTVTDSGHLPSPHARLRVAGRGWGWGEGSTDESLNEPPTPPAFAIASAGDPPRRFASLAGGG